MKRFISLALLSLALSGCAQTPEQAAAYRQFGMMMLAGQAQQAEQCDSISLPPMASLGCKNVCINGRWAEVCGK